MFDPIGLRRVGDDELNRRLWTHGLKESGESNGGIGFSVGSRSSFR